MSSQNISHADFDEYLESFIRQEFQLWSRDSFPHNEYSSLNVAKKQRNEWISSVLECRQTGATLVEVIDRKHRSTVRSREIERREQILERWLGDLQRVKKEDYYYERGHQATLTVDVFTPLGEKVDEVSLRMPDDSLKLELTWKELSRAICINIQKNLGYFCTVPWEHRDSLGVHQEIASESEHGGSDGDSPIPVRWVPGIAPVTAASVSIVLRKNGIAKPDTREDKLIDYDDFDYFGIKARRRNGSFHDFVMEVVCTTNLRACAKAVLDYEADLLLAFPTEGPTPPEALTSPVDVSSTVAATELFRCLEDREELIAPDGGMRGGRVTTGYGRFVNYNIYLPSRLGLFDDCVRDSESVVMAAAKRKVSDVVFASPRLRKDEKFAVRVLEACHCPDYFDCPLQYLHEDLRDSEDVVFASVHRDIERFKKQSKKISIFGNLDYKWENLYVRTLGNYASRRLLNSEEFACRLVEKFGVKLLKYFDKNVRKAESVVKSLVISDLCDKSSTNCPGFEHQCADRFRDNPSFIADVWTKCIDDLLIAGAKTKFGKMRKFFSLIKSRSTRNNPKVVAALDRFVDSIDGFKSIKTSNFDSCTELPDQIIEKLKRLKPVCVRCPDTVTINKNKDHDLSMHDFPAKRQKTCQMSDALACSHCGKVFKTSSARADHENSRSSKCWLTRSSNLRYCEDQTRILFPSIQKF